MVERIGNSVGLRGVYVLTAVCGVALVIAVVGWLYVDMSHREMKCQARLGKELYPAILRPDGTLLPADRFAMSSAGNMRCAYANEPFVYQPIDGVVRYGGAIEQSVVLFRMIAWCPRPCHRNARVVLLENGAVQLLSESSFQCAVANGYRCENRSRADPQPESQMSSGSQLDPK
jgi:hypothetical protein